MAIQGIVGSVNAGTNLLNAFLVASQKIDFDVQGPDKVAFMFAYRDEDNVDLRSDITDHFTEENTAIQDQIALRPIEITLHGFIGELTDSLPGKYQQIKNAIGQLSLLGIYLPELTVAALAAYNEAEQIYRVGASAVETLQQAFPMLTDGTQQTKQQKAYNYFEEKWRARTLFQVQTPWRMFDNMAILSLRASQDGSSRYISDFKITFKQIQFAKVEYSEEAIPLGRRVAQTGDKINQGPQNPLDLGNLQDSLGDKASLQSQVFGGMSR